MFSKKNTYPDVLDTMFTAEKNTAADLLDVLSGNESIKTDVGIYLDTQSIILLSLGVILTGFILIYISKKL